jgi:hypothetical protein
MRSLLVLTLAVCLLATVPLPTASAGHLSKAEKRKVIRIVKRLTEPDWSKAKIRRKFFGHNKADRKRLNTLPLKRSRVKGKTKKISTDAAGLTDAGEDEKCYRTFGGGTRYLNAVGWEQIRVTLVKTWCAVPKAITYHPRPRWDVDVTWAGQVAGMKVDRYSHLVHQYAPKDECKEKLRCHISAQSVTVEACFFWYVCTTSFMKREGVLAKWKGTHIDVDARY